MSQFVEIKSENFHKLEVVCRLDTKCYSCVFLYKDDSIPVPKRVDVIRIYTRTKFGKLIKDGKEINGILLVDFEIEETETALTFITKEKKSTILHEEAVVEEKVEGERVLPTSTPSSTSKSKKTVMGLLSESKREEVISYANYPFLPLQQVTEKLQIPESNNDSSERNTHIDISKIRCSKNSEPFLFVLSQIFDTLPPADGIDSDDCMDKYISLIKEYKYAKMKELMELNERFYSKTLSSCIFLSIEILKEFPSYKWSWVDVTKNSAIPIRDIMNNSDLPWDNKSIIEREDISLEILESIGIDVVDYGKDIDIISPKTRTFSEFERRLSPQEPIIIKYGSDIKDEVINAAIDEVLEKYPEYLNSEDISSKLEKLRNEVITCIRMYGEFSIDSFDLPIEEVKETDEEYIFNEHSVDSVITESDPLGIAGLIFAMKTCKDGFKKRALEDIYHKKTGYQHYSIDYDELVQNRSDYVELLRSRTSYKYDSLETYSFFSTTDVLEYPIAFGIMGSGVVAQFSLKKVLLKSGKLTHEFLMSSDIIWSLNDLVYSMPHKFVIENLLFFPTRIHLPYIKENLCKEDHNSASLALEFTIQDEKAMSVFCERSDFNVDIPDLYPDIKWEKKSLKTDYFLSLMIPSEVKAIMNYEPVSFAEMDEDCDSFNPDLILMSMTFSDLRTAKGVKVLNKYLKLSLNEETSFDTISKMSDVNIYKKYSSLCYGMFFQEVLLLSVEDVKRNPSFKFKLPIKFDLYDFYTFYKKKSESETLPQLIGFLLISSKGFDIYIPHREELLLSAVFAIEMYSVNTCKDKSKYYNNFVESVKNSLEFLKMFDISEIRIKHFIECLSFIFDTEAVKGSKYTYLNRIQF